MHGMRTPNRFQRGFQRFAALRPVAFASRHSAHHLDRVAVKLLHGRTVSGLLAGIPTIMLTTTGASTGQPRTVPLVGLNVEGALAIVGTSFGSGQHPGWYYNLTKNPHASVEVNGTRTAVVARSVPDGPEYERIMALADTVYVGYAKYRSRIEGRRIPIFVLDPATTT
jgi:deazaflavin-dependent oxidoreductase (nitroreductase family)